MQKRVMLQPRDLLAFKRLCEFGYLTLPQISEHVFKASYKKTARRLTLLRDKGFVRFVWRRDYVGSRVYIPEMKALHGVVDSDTYQLGVKATELKPWFRSLHHHEDAVREIALKFLNSLSLTTVVELDHQLKPSDWGLYSDEDEAKRKLPDFVLHIDGMPKIAVEVELTAKSTTRYEDILEHIFRMDQAHVVYLTSSEAVRAKIRNILEGVLHKRLQSGNPVHKILILELSQTNSERGIHQILDWLTGREIYIDPRSKILEQQKAKLPQFLKRGDLPGDTGEKHGDLTRENPGTNSGENGYGDIPRRRMLSEIIQ